jgi:serine/threonine protein kinase
MNQPVNLNFVPGQVLSTVLKLDWSETDNIKFPWLKRRTRYYIVEEFLNKGAFGTTWTGFPCSSEKSKKEIPGSPRVVIKRPNIDLDGYTPEENNRRLTYIRDKNYVEINQLRKNLLQISHGKPEPCPHANLILDIIPYTYGSLELPITVQLFLEGASDLNGWLTKGGIRPEAAKLSLSPWTGIPDRRVWGAIGLKIGLAIADIHRLRGRHGDIHPGNVFITESDPNIAILIDFGEGFAATPALNWRKLHIPRPYFAPERLGHRIPLNEQIDVFSFGILLHYLATGNAPLFDFQYHRGAHVQHVYKLLATNSRLIHNEPRIANLIARSTAEDPSDRPRMLDLCDDLKAISMGDQPFRLPASPSDVTLRNIAQYYQPSENHNPLLLNVLDYHVRELHFVAAGLKTEMVELYGTRDQMIRSLVLIWEQLQHGDSWNAVTTLPLWQGSALGLGGGYLTANIRAAARGVAIRRVFAISIAELGRPFAKALAKRLSKNKNDQIKRLSKLLDDAIASYDNTIRTHKQYRTLDNHQIYWHRTRLKDMLGSLHDVLDRWDLKRYAATVSDIDIEDFDPVQLIYFGICPVGTLDDVGAVREENPVVLMHLPKAEKEGHRWVLVGAEVRGRSIHSSKFEPPHLLGIRVYQSVHGKPQARITHLRNLISKKTANITQSLNELHGIVTQLCEDYNTTGPDSPRVSAKKR